MGSEKLKKALASSEKERTWYQQRLGDTLALLEDSLTLINQGKTHFTYVIAGQLRLLLCDTTRIHDKIVDVSLLKKLEPDLVLGMLNAQGEFEKNSRTIPLGEWLKQTVFLNGKDVTIYQLIRQVSDERGGVHADFHKSRNADKTSETSWMKRIAEHILERLKQ